MEPGEAFGRVLKIRRKRQGLTQEELALEAGLERVFISLLERGLRQPSLTTLLKLAPPLGCTAGEIVSGVEALLRSEG